MEDVLIRIINIIMDSIEEFFNVIKIPSAKYITDAFLVSLVFLALSVINVFLNFSFFVSWQEALTCSILLLIVMLVDSSTRSSLRKQADNIRGIAAMKLQKQKEGEQENDD